jgi:hypothetical protein
MVSPNTIVLPQNYKNTKFPNRALLVELFFFMDFY